jgi:PAS domain S-box-containing protein
VSSSPSEIGAVLHVVLAGTEDLIWVVDAERCAMLAFTPAMAKYFRDASGVTVGLGKTPEDLLPHETAGTWRSCYARALASGPFAQELAIAGRDRPLRLFFQPLSIGDRCFGISVHGQEISEQGQSERFLREGEARYRTLLDYAPEAIVVLDVDTGRFVDANANACRLFGCERSQLFELGPSMVSPPVQPGGIPTPDMAMAKIREAVEGRSTVFEWTHRKVTGETFPCEVRLVRLPSLDRCLLRGSIIDISERRRLEQEAAQMQSRLEQSQRLEALGTLAGGIAHDFNNILGGIMGYTDLAMLELPADASILPLLENVQRGANRAVDLVRQILAFSRQTPGEKRPVNLRLILKEALRLIRATLPATIAIHEDADIETWVFADPGQLHQIVMNLCTNARLAMHEHGGELKLGIRERQLDARFADAHPDTPPGRYASLTVADTGCGIPPEHIEHIFEPFFTTRPKGQGTGLGLSVVHGIVKSFGGTITVTSRVGIGTTFEVLLPVCAAQGGPTDETPGLTQGRGRILFVDDEVDLTAVARHGLTRAGYDVMDFNDPLAALAAFQATPHAFDIVITDMTMPGLTGEALAGEIRRLRPDIPIVLASGFSDRITPDEARAAGFDEFVDKPLRMTVLAQLIQRLLRGIPR